MFEGVNARLIGEKEDSYSRTAKLEEVKGRKCYENRGQNENHVKNHETLKKIILAVGMCENMSEQEIRKNILESTEWEKNVDTLGRSYLLNCGFCCG